VSDDGIPLAASRALIYVPAGDDIDGPTMRMTDAAHLALMLAAIGLTFLVPFELLLLSYVVLGPAHYATEIS
jgi:hypothetical protein